MYKIMSGGEVIALCDKVNYIRYKPESGAFVAAKFPYPKQGIAVNGKPYNLPGHTEIQVDGVAMPEAYAVEVDGGEMIVAGMNEVETTTGDALCELDAGLEDVKDALCEIDGILEGGN